MKKPGTDLYITTTRTNSNMLTDYKTTIDVGAVEIGLTRPSNCSEGMGFNALPTGTFTLEFQTTDLPQTVDLEVLFDQTLTTGSMDISGFSFWSWDHA